MSLNATFTEALIQAKRRRSVLPSEFYGRLPAHALAQSFTVSGLASLSQIVQVLDGLTTALQAGTSFADWKKQALADVPDLANLPKGRLETIYRNAMLNAYNAGRYAQMRANPNRRFWLYDGVIDGRTSDVCRALDGKIYHADSPVWRAIHPPNHHNCRSTLIGLTEAQARARGYKPGQPDIIPPEGQPEPGWSYNPATGLDDALNAAAAAGNATIARQYAPLVAQRPALLELGRRVQAEQKLPNPPDLEAVLAQMIAAIIAALVA